MVGLLTQLKEEFEKMPFVKGDSATPDTRKHYDILMAKLDLYLQGNEPFTLVIDDPVANSYIQNFYAPDPDPNMTVEEYERTFQQNEELGLNDIKTEDY